MVHKQFDCIVLGGGLIGLTAALALSKLDLNIAIVERNPLEKLRKVVVIKGLLQYRLAAKSCLIH